MQKNFEYFHIKLEGISNIFDQDCINNAKDFQRFQIATNCEIFLHRSAEMHEYFHLKLVRISKIFDQDCINAKIF